MKRGIFAAVAAIVGIIVALLIREQGRRAVAEAELWVEAGDQEPQDDPDLSAESV